MDKFTLSSSLSASQRYFSAWKRPHSYWMKCRIPGSVIPESPSCSSRACDDPGMAAAAAAAAAAIAPVPAADVAWPGADLGPFGLRPAPLLPPPEFGFGPPPDLSASILTVQPSLQDKEAETGRVGTIIIKTTTSPQPSSPPGALHDHRAPFFLLTRTEQNYYSLRETLHFPYQHLHNKSPPHRRFVTSRPV